MIDDQLDALRTSRLPAGLADMESRVSAGIARSVERRNALRITGAAAAGALLIGVMSPTLLAPNAAAAPFDPIADATALAPSTLLEPAR
jgi:hypothetical protein